MHLAWLRNQPISYHFQANPHKFCLKLCNSGRFMTKYIGGIFRRSNEYHRTSHNKIVVDFPWIETFNQNRWQIDMHRITHIEPFSVVLRDCDTNSQINSWKKGRKRRERERESSKISRAHWANCWHLICDKMTNWQIAYIIVYNCIYVGTETYDARVSSISHGRIHNDETSSWNAIKWDSVTDPVPFPELLNLRQI